MAAPTDAFTRALLADASWVHRLARAMLRDHDPAGAEDVAQDVLAATLARRPPVRPGDGLRAWLRRVTARRAATWLRDRGKVPTNTPPADGLPAPQPDPARTVERLQLQELVTAAVTGLTEPYRSVVVARYFDGQSAEQIAATRGEQPATVRKQMSRAVAALRARLRRDLGEDWRRRAALALAWPLGPSNAAAHGKPFLGWMLVKNLPVAAAVLASLLVILGLWWSTVDPGPSSRTPGTVESPVAARSRDAPGNDPVGAARRVAVAEASRARPLSVRVRTEAGQPLAGASVVVVPAELVGVEGVTDERLSELPVRTTGAAGTVTFPEEALASTGPGSGVLVAPDGRPKQWVEPDDRHLASGGDLEVVCPPGAAVRGKVTVMGSPPARPIRLRLRWTDWLPGEVADVCSGLHHWQFRWGEIRTEAEPGTGAFAFHGLEEDWQDRLQLLEDEPFALHPQRCRPEATGSRVWLRAGTEDILLDVVPVPAVSGRVVFEDGTPVRGASISADPTFDPELLGDMGASNYLLTDRDGRFRFGTWSGDHDDRHWFDPATQPRLARIRVSAGHPLALRRVGRQVEFANGPTGGGPVERIPDIVLTRAPVLHARLLTGKGEPVRGAVVEGLHFSRDSGADGRTVVPVEDPARTRFRIGAPGWLVAEYEAVGGDGSPEDPLQFVLRPANRIVVRFVSDSMTRYDVELRIRGWRHSDLHQLSGHSTVGMGVVPWEKQWWEKHGGGQVPHAVLTSLGPGLAVELRAVDRLRQTVAAQTVRCPDAGEEITVVLEPEHPTAILQGRVLLDGEGVRAGMVFDSESTPARAVPRMRQDGTWRLAVAATGQRTSVTVQHKDCPWLEGEFLLAPGVQHRDFHLQRGLEMTVVIVDGEGRPVPSRVDGAATLRPLKGPGRTDLGNGRYRLTRLPARPLDLEIRYAGRKLRRTVDPRTAGAGAVPIRVPTAATVHLLVPDDVPRNQGLSLRLQPKTAGHAQGERAIPVTTSLRFLDGKWDPAALRVYPGTWSVSCATLRGEGWRTTWTLDGDTRRWLFRDD